MLKSTWSVEPGLNLGSRKNVYSNEDELQLGETPAEVQGMTGDGKVGVRAGNGDALPSAPMRNAVAGVTEPDPAHAPVLEGFTHEAGCRKPSPRRSEERRGGKVGSNRH